MKIDWEAIIYIVLIIMVGSCGMVEIRSNKEIEMKKIEYCREMKIQNCPEVK